MDYRRTFTPAVVFIIALIAPAAWGQSITVNNHSFEIPDLTTSGFGDVLPQVLLWVETGPTTTIVDPDFGEFEGLLDTGIFVNTPVILDPQLPPFAGPIPNVDGNQLAFMVANPTAETPVTLSQQTTAAFQVGLDYQLTVAVGVSLLFPPFSADPVNNPAFMELALGYLDGDDLFQTVAATLVSPASFPTPPSGEQVALIDFDLFTGLLGVDDTALGELITIRFRPLGGDGGAWNLDNVRLEAIPEPGSAALLMLGSAALLLRRRQQ